MPELPEVETYRRFLESTSLHQTITYLFVEDPKLLTTDYDTLSHALEGNQFTGTHRVGKNLFVHTRTGAVLTMHFGMTGSLAYFRDEEDTPRYARIVFSFDNGFRLGFLCPRKFERIGLTDNIPEYLKRKKLGNDALETTPEELLRIFRRKNGPVKPVLMDQSTLAGLGNWIVDEVLFMAGIHPEQQAAALTGAEVERLHAAIREVLLTAIEHEAVYSRFPAGYLIHAREWDTSPYSDPEGHQLCPRCRAGIHKSYVGGRATYYCTTCQLPPIVKPAK
jgi:formamidopyrimidine-DNA glycosylase